MSRQLSFARPCVLLFLSSAVLLAQPSSYTISTIAGTGTAGFTGDGAAATSATLSGPIGIALDSSRNIYFSDSINNRIRKITGANISTIAGNGTIAYGGDGGAATSANFNSPYGVVVDNSGNIYIADLLNHVVRVVSNGNISTFAGNNIYGFSGDGGSPTSAQLNQPFGLALDSSNNLYISDSNNNRVRKISGGIITTVAGNGFTDANDGNPATNSGLNRPYGIAVDSAGNLFIADSNNHRIRKVSAADGTISTVAGTGTA